YVTSLVQCELCVVHCLSGSWKKRAHCNTSTTFSFNSEGYVHMQLPVFKNKTKPNVLHMQLRFRSTLPDMVLYYRGTVENFVSLELVKGSLQAKVKSGKLLWASYPGPVNDGEWHTVTVTMDERLVVAVKGPGCEEGCQVKNEGRNHLIFLQPSSFQQLYIGGAPQKYVGNLSSGKAFIGCMEDFQVDNKLLLPQDLSREENSGLTLGCTKPDWCGDDPCMQRGRCVDMWVGASCQCHRPYYGEKCEKGRSKHLTSKECNSKCY
uniref:Laminin G domain-containing protein n=1 Tax=Neolamprologus brichardi TaxID=32507 RepID=A0A3Q4H7D7_NEOBR